MDEIKVKALINKEKNKVLFVECNADFVDVLFSFLTMPTGTIIKLTKSQQPPTMVGSMNNLYNSVEFLDLKYFRTNQCKAMLLRPRSIADNRIKNIGMALGNNQVYDLFFCKKSDCSHNLFSYYEDAYCHCGNIMNRKMTLGGLELADKDGEVFVKGLTRYIISDELQIAPLSTAATLSLLSKERVKTGSCNAIEEKNFVIGRNEILVSLKSLLVSKAPLTEMLLKNSLKGAEKENVDGTALKKRKIEPSLGGCNGRNICIKLIVSKTNGAVYYTESNGDFIDLLFSFLIIPLGNVAKAIEGDSSEGCARNLYQSVESLDAMVNLVSEKVKQSLLFPSIPRHFGIEERLLSVKEVGQYYYEANGSTRTRKLKLLDPKSRDNREETKSSSGGYVKERSMFTVSDNLRIALISPLSSLSVLRELNMPFSDIEERIVHVGKEEAAHLLAASLISNSPLTDVFGREVPKPETLTDSQMAMTLWEDC